MSSKLPKNSDQRSDSTSDVLKRTMVAALEGATGVAASEKREIATSLGRILQRIRGGKFVSQIKTEWEDYRARGRIKDDYIDTEQHQECLQELLDFLDSDVPDKVRFSALKSIFLNAATEKTSDRDSVLPQQYMKIIRSISSGEAIVLFTAYYVTDVDIPAGEWLTRIAKRSGLKFSELVSLHEENLIEKRLLAPRAHPDKSGIRKGHHGRLTSLGYNVCLYIGEDEIKGHLNDS